MTYRVTILPKGTCSLYDEDVWVVQKVLKDGQAVHIATFEEHEVACALIGIISQSLEVASGSKIEIGLESLN